VTIAGSASGRQMGNSYRYIKAFKKKEIFFMRSEKKTTPYYFWIRLNSNFLTSLYRTI
jgi:hypothetical protein